MTDQEKEAIIKSAAELIARDLGIKGDIKIEFFNEDSGLRGAFNYKTGTIRINKYYFNVYSVNESDSASQILRVLSHELRHQFQFETDMFKGVKYVPYDSTLGNYKEYYNGVYEVDARRYANMIVEILRLIRGW